MKNNPNKRRGAWEFFPFSDDFLLFFLPILDDEEQRRLEAIEEEYEPRFEDFVFDAYSKDNEFEEDFGINDNDD